MNWAYITGYFDGEGHVSTIPVRQHTKISLTWTNTHLPSLRAMLRFMGTGRIRGHKRANKRCKACYIIQIADRDSLVRVIPKMLRHAIIKRDKLRKVLKLAKAMTSMKDRAPHWGALVAAGKGEIKKLYWKDGLSLGDIAGRFGVTGGAVKLFMARNGIKKRSRRQGWNLALQDPKKRKLIFSGARNGRVAQAQRRLWATRSHRAKMVAAFRSR